MTTTLKITNGTTTVDLLNGVFQLADAGWETESNDEPVWDTFTCLVFGTGAQIRQEQNNLDLLAKKAYLYLTDIKENTPVLLKVAGEGETTKQVVVLDIKSRFHSDSNMTPLLAPNAEDEQTLQMVTVAVLRTPYFEPDLSTTSYSAVAIGNLSDAGGQYDFGASTLPSDQRIAKLTVSDDAAPAANHKKIWVGFRRRRYGVTGFKSRWDGADVAAFGTDTDLTADTGSLNGSFSVLTTFATATDLKDRIPFLINYYCGSSPMDMVGEYLVLGRLKLSSGTTEVHVQLKQGHLAYGTLTSVAGDIYLSAVTDTNLTNWNLIELGHVQIPTTGNREAIAGGENGLNWFGVSLWAERMSASGSLYTDCLVFIPTDHYGVFDDCRIGGGIDELKVITSILNEQIALGETPNTGPLGGVKHYSVNFALNNWFYPAEGGVLVVAGQDTSQHVKDKTLDIAIELCPRYPMFRI